MKKLALAVCVGAVSLLAVPSAATAQVSTTSEVRQALRELAGALRSADRGEHREAARQLRRNIRHTIRAVSASRREARSDALRGFRANRRLVQLTDRNLQGMLELAARSRGSARRLAAQQVRANLLRRGQALNRTASLVGDLPEDRRQGVANWLLTVGPPTAQIQSILDAIGDVPGSLRPAIERALELASGHIDQALARVEQVIPTLPEAAQGPVTAALQLVRENVQMAMGIVSGVLDGVLGGGVAGVADSLKQIFEMVGQIVSGTVSGFGSGIPGLPGLPVPDSGAGNPAAGMLGQIMDLVQGLLSRLGGGFAFGTTG